MKLRIDKWLWAARFFKTRALATVAVNGGKVHVNGNRVKPAKEIKIGDELSITRGSATWIVKVQDLSEKRGPARLAQLLYKEQEESRVKREEQAAMQKALRQSAPRPPARPDKKSRRELRRIKTGE
ncbi:MAG: RNA-binding protein [Gammaproteobacteria bacterium]|nr:RNA-binding protein [Gammaproteobacteria bacterium]